MIAIEIKKEIFARIKLPELEVEARVLIDPRGDVELIFTPWTNWKLSGQSFEQMVEDYNLLMAHIRLCLENQGQEELKEPVRGQRVEK